MVKASDSWEKKSGDNSKSWTKKTWEKVAHGDLKACNT